MGTFKDLAGQIFGQWTVIESTKRRAKNGAVYWKCQCSCGTIRQVKSDTLTGKTSTACYKCGQENSKKQFCLNGHDTVVWGRNRQGHCYACLKDKHLQKSYGINLQDFIQLYESQGGKCYICERRFIPVSATKFAVKGSGCSRMEVDHDHKIKDKRKSVRGLLCGGKYAGCNNKLGRIDNPVWLAKASNYIADPPAQKILFKKGE